jgi:hypothetical protein
VKLFQKKVHSAQAQDKMKHLPQWPVASYQNIQGIIFATMSIEDLRIVKTRKCHKNGKHDISWSLWLYTENVSKCYWLLQRSCLQIEDSGTSFWRIRIEEWISNYPIERNNFIIPRLITKIQSPDRIAGRKLCQLSPIVATILACLKSIVTMFSQTVSICTLPQNKIR